MGGVFWIIVAGAVAALVGLLLTRHSPFVATWRRNRFIEACRRFHWQREHLEARFVQVSQLQCKPGSPRWVDCDFSDDVSYVRNRYTGELSAFVSVTILLEVPQAANLGSSVREATAVFRFGRDRWETDGRAIFNLSPSETVRFYQHDIEMVGQELSGQR